MNHVRRIFFTAVATLAGAVLALTASSAAFAMRLPPGGDRGNIAPPPPPTRVINEGGMPGWQIIVIALSAALVAAAVAVLLDRVRTAHKVHAAV